MTEKIRAKIHSSLENDKLSIISFSLSKFLTKK